MREVKFQKKNHVHTVRKIRGSSIVSENLMDLFVRSSTLIFVCNTS